MKKGVLCSISTRGRYNTTLPMALSAIINQTRKPDKLVLFDDNDVPKDLREEPTYFNLFKMLDIKDIKWECIFGQKKGQHYNHQIANKMGYEWVWRVDDDNIPEPDVLEKLMSRAKPGIGAVGGSILTPTWVCEENNATGIISKIDDEPNIQWGEITKEKYVDHLHCSFIYRAGIQDYNLGLSRVAHREETLFTYGLKIKGYQNLVIPNCITWHMKSPEGGIRSEDKSHLYYHDEKIFKNIVGLKERTIVVLNCGMGDHIVFKHVLPEIKNPLVFCCYSDIVPGRPITEAIDMLGDIEPYNIYAKMDEWGWKDSLENAFRKMYVK
jgi:hypothetical protein